MLFTHTLAAASMLVSPQQAASQQLPRSPVAVPDCNDNGVADRLDISAGTSFDCDGNLVPDECDLGVIVVFSESFEAGLPQEWVQVGDWVATTDCQRPTQCDGPSFMFCKNDLYEDLCLMGEGSSNLGTPSIALPAGAESIELKYCSAYQGEGEDPYDAADVLVNGQLLDHVSPLPRTGWETRTVDLSSFAGEVVSIEFSYDTGDGFANDFLGWQVDNVRVLAYAPGAGSPFDCNVNGVFDACEPDCNGSGLPDDCDVALGASADCDLNGVPDECELATADCNLNGIPDECDLRVDLQTGLSWLEERHETVTGFFPDVFQFAGGESGMCIQDGGQGLFDCGNELATLCCDFLQGEVRYTDNSVRTSSTFGPDSQYFTAKFDGLFVMAASGLELSDFFVSGRTGAVDEGTVDSYESSVVVAGEPHHLFVRRVHGAGIPSTNQILIVPGDGAGIVHSTSPHTEDCTQALRFIQGIDRIYYVFASRWDGKVGLPLRPVDAREIATEILLGMPGPVSADANRNGVPDECE